MHTVIYQAEVKKDKEQEYKKAWHACAQYFVDHCGALGSSLYKTEQGQWIAISRWPSKELRNRVWNNPEAPEAIKKVTETLKACLESYTETVLELVDEVKLSNQ